MIGLVKGLGVVGNTLASIGLASIVQAVLAVSWIDAVGPLLSATVAGFTAWLTFRQRSNENRIAEAEHEQEGMQGFLTELRADNREQGQEVAQLRADVSRLFGIWLTYREGVSRLVNQIEGAGLEPVWRPDPNDDDLVLGRPQ